MDLIQNNWQIVSFIIVGICLIYTLFIKDKLSANKILTTEQLAEIDQIVARGVVYAQKLYESDSTVNVQKITLEYVLAEVKLSKIVPDEFLNYVEVVVKSKI